ncbi:uncharacterized protein [Nicotiana sylvestris]|uniref:uncharacterized protein n=1 Tax=Nicotiana sylvestris TaxID=4096 RepID=UPI00388CC91E
MTIFHDMIHKEIEVYVDYVIINFRKQSDHVRDLRKFIQRLRRYNLKLNPAKCVFGVPLGKLLGFIFSMRGIELDLSKIKAIQELLPPKNKTEVMSLLGRLNYINKFIAQLTTTCEPIFKLLKKDLAVKWTEECQETFDKIKEYLSNPPVLVPPKLGRPLILCLTILDNSFGCVLGRLAKWQILLTEFDIIYVTRTAIKAQALADHLAENPVDEEYEPLKNYFPDKEVMHIDEVEMEEKPGWKLFFDGAANMKGVGIGAVLISKNRASLPCYGSASFLLYQQHGRVQGMHFGFKASCRYGDPGSLGVRRLGLAGAPDSRRMEFKHIPRIHNEVADALATLVSMLHHPDKAYVDPLHIQVRAQYAYYNMVEEELDGEPWFHDIREYIRMRVSPAQATGDQNRTIRRLASGFFFSGGVLYKRTPDLGLLRCMDAIQATGIITEVHSRVEGPHMSRYVLAEKILRAGYYWLTMERDCISFVHKCHQCQVHGDLIHSPPSELHTMYAR